MTTPMTNISLRKLKTAADEKKRLELIEQHFNQMYLSVISSATAGETQVSIPLERALVWYETNFPFIADKLYASFPEACIQLQITTFLRCKGTKNTISMAELSTIRKLGSTGILPELSVLVDWSGEETGV
jgi:hypothetical protein